MTPDVEVFNDLLDRIEALANKAGRLESEREQFRLAIEDAKREIVALQSEKKSLALMNAEYVQNRDRAITACERAEKIEREAINIIRDLSAAARAYCNNRGRRRARAFASLQSAILVADAKVEAFRPF
jgi:chromosome segregation ATPase